MTDCYWFLKGHASWTEVYVFWSQKFADILIGHLCTLYCLSFTRTTCESYIIDQFKHVCGFMYNWSYTSREKSIVLKYQILYFCIMMQRRYKSILCKLLLLFALHSEKKLFGICHVHTQLNVSKCINGISILIFLDLPYQTFSLLGSSFCKRPERRHWPSQQRDKEDRK